MKPALPLSLAIAALLLVAGCSPKPADTPADQAADAAAANAIANETKAMADLEGGVRVQQLEKRMDELEKQLGELQAKQEVKDAIAASEEQAAQALPPLKK